MLDDISRRQPQTHKPVPKFRYDNVSYCAEYSCLRQCWTDWCLFCSFQKDIRGRELGPHGAEAHARCVSC